jgi:cytosine/uracil/thiamine/allantoin permease
MIYKTLHRRTDNTMAKRKRQTMIYKTLHRRTDNSMAKRKRTNNDLQNITQKDRQFNGQKTKDKQ